MLLNKCYAFVINVSSLSGAPTYQLATGHELRRANSDEIDPIKRTIASLGSHEFPDYRLWGGRLEELCPTSLQEPSVRVVGKLDSALPREEWRYYVVALQGDVALSGDIDVLNQLTSAFDLARVELEVGFTIANLEIGGKPKVVKIYDAARLFHMVEATSSGADSLVDVSTEDISEIVSIHGSLRAYDHHTVDLKRALEQMSDLKRLPHGSPLRFLGYFGILESLLTHQPRQTDTIDSITRQVRTKLALLNKRFERAIDHNDFADSLDKVWTTMYRYRSVVAHGGIADFKADLKLLKSPKRALSLLKETTKALIKHTLREPTLIKDLREC